MSREAFRQRFVTRFYDLAFRVEDASLVRLAEIAWGAYAEGRKSPIPRRQGRDSRTRATSCQSSGTKPVNESRPRSESRLTRRQREPRSHRQRIVAE